MSDLNDILKKSKFIIVPLEIYEKIIPLDMKDIETFLKERNKIIKKQRDKHE